MQWTDNPHQPSWDTKLQSMPQCQIRMFESCLFAATPATTKNKAGGKGRLFPVMAQVEAEIEMT